MSQKITIGCDPEVFVSHGDTIISGIGIVGGSKNDPRPVECGTLQEDNVLAEIGITPAATEDEFVTYVTTVLSQLRSHLKQHDDMMDFKIVSSHEMDDFFLQDARAMQFGCEPDFNAYTGLANPKPEATTNLRTAGGHIHIGYDITEVSQQDVIKVCDVLIGLPSVIFDGDATRMKLYGKPGAYRPKPYGVEYRTPSNYWLQSENYMRWIFRQAKRAVECAKDTQFMEIVNAHAVATTRAISRADRPLAEQLCAYFGVAVTATA